MVHVLKKSILAVSLDKENHSWAPISELSNARVREQRPIGFPLIFTKDMQLIEPAVLYLHEHYLQRGYSKDTLRTYCEILQDWFETLEQNDVAWKTADAVDLFNYRNRMITQLSKRTGRGYRTTTINHRVRGVIRFYQWCYKMEHLRDSQLINGIGYSSKKESHHIMPSKHLADGSIFTLSQYENLLKPLTERQANSMIAELAPPYDLMARWQLHTGMRISEVLQVRLDDIPITPKSTLSKINLIRKGRKAGYVLANSELLNETAAFISTYRISWSNRALLDNKTQHDSNKLFLGSRGTPVERSAYQKTIRETGKRLGFPCTSHLLRTTFACLLLKRLEALAASGEPVNPLLVVKILMGHSHIETTDRYLRAVSVEAFDIDQVLKSLTKDK